MKLEKMNIVLILGALMIGVTGLTWADDDEDEYPSRFREKGSQAQNQLYVEECGGCHFPYQPGLLPAVSWKRMMDGLADHFGEDVELSPQDSASISNYLESYASRRFRYLRTADAAPLRITETPHFRHEHDEIPRRMVEDNPDVNTLGNCGACHQRAHQGNFDDDYIRIPGYGRWDD